MITILILSCIWHGGFWREIYYSLIITIQSFQLFNIFMCLLFLVEASLVIVWSLLQWLQRQRYCSIAVSDLYSSLAF